MDHRSGQGVVIWRWVGRLLSVAAVGFVVRWLLRLDHHIWSKAFHVNGWWLIASVAIFQIWFFSRFLAWEFLSRRHGYGHQRHQNIRMWALSELMRYVPGNVWSFAARYRGTRTAGSEQGEALQAILLEGIGLLSGAALVSGVVATSRPIFWLGPVGALLIILFLPIVLPRVWHRWKPNETIPHFSSPKLVVLCALYAATWIIYGLANLALYRAFGTAVPAMGALSLIAFTTTAWLIGYISVITPMGIGVREVSFVGLTTGVLTTAVASLFAAVSRLWLVISELFFLGLVIIVVRRRH